MMGRPAPYPASCRPQAWSAASIGVLVSVALGLRPDGEGGLVVSPPHPAPFGALRVEGCGSGARVRRRGRRGRARERRGTHRRLRGRGRERLDSDGSPGKDCLHRGSARIDLGSRRSQGTAGSGWASSLRRSARSSSTPSQDRRPPRPQPGRRRADHRTAPGLRQPRRRDRLRHRAPVVRPQAAHGPPRLHRPAHARRPVRLPEPRAESEHDVVENSHASTSLSWADGIAKARRLRASATGTRSRSSATGH